MPVTIAYDGEPSPPTILVVDDEQPFRSLVHRWLSSAGYTVQEAADGDQALLALQERAIALITLDINLPECSGLDLIPRFKEAAPDVEIVMLSGLENAQTAISALSRGATDYLTKPVERDDFLFHVARGLERRALLRGKRIYTQRLEERVREQTVQIRRAHEETIQRLVTATMWRDEETGAHIRRTGLFSEALARAAGWSVAEAEEVRLAAPMHDVGKIGIPDAILRKPTQLTAEEFQIMKTHTAIGAAMLSGSSVPILKVAAQIALSHHERWDGTGYPQGITGENIPECARILSIVDVYDALTHDRVYRPAFAEDQAIAMLCEGQGKQFDPTLLTIFLSILADVREISGENPDRPPDDGESDPLADVVSQKCKFSELLMAETTS